LALGEEDGSVVEGEGRSYDGVLNIFYKVAVSFLSERSRAYHRLKVPSKQERRVVAAKTNISPPSKTSVPFSSPPFLLKKDVKLLAERKE